jgi:hypothetical protein
MKLLKRLFLLFTLFVLVLYIIHLIIRDFYWPIPQNFSWFCYYIYQIYFFVLGIAIIIKSIVLFMNKDIFLGIFFLMLGILFLIFRQYIVGYMLMIVYGT